MSGAHRLRYSFEERTGSIAVCSASPRFDNELGMTMRNARVVAATMIEIGETEFRGSHREIEMFSGEVNLASVNIESDADGVVRSIS
jgi:hypothetical protein